MKNRKQYMREWKIKNKEKVSADNKTYYKNNKEYFQEYLKGYRILNFSRDKGRYELFRKKNRTKYNKYSANWRINNKDRWNEYIKKDKLKYPIKHKARIYSYNHNFKRPFCLLHKLEGQEEPSIHFHHTDYEANLGFSVCMEHHKIADNWVN